MHVYTIDIYDIFPDGQNFQIFCQFEQTKMAISRPFHRIIVFKACVEYQEEICIGVGDIHLDGQIFQIFCQFEQTKIAMSRPL